jgi:hypothetical protein
MARAFPIGNTLRHNAGLQHRWARVVVSTSINDTIYTYFHPLCLYLIIRILTKLLAIRGLRQCRKHHWGALQPVSYIHNHLIMLCQIHDQCYPTPHVHLTCHTSHHSMSTYRTITFAPPPLRRGPKRKSKAKSKSKAKRKSQVIFRPFRYVDSHILCARNNSHRYNSAPLRPRRSIAEQNDAAAAAHQRALEWARKLEMTPDEEEEMEVRWMLTLKYA